MNTPPRAEVEVVLLPEPWLSYARTLFVAVLALALLGMVLVAIHGLRVWVRDTRPTPSIPPPWLHEPPRRSTRLGPPPPPTPAPAELVPLATAPPAPEHWQALGPLQGQAERCPTCGEPATMRHPDGTYSCRAHARWDAMELREGAST